VALDPSRDGTVLLYARLLVEGDQPEEALRWLRALALRSPASLEVWEAIAEAAGRAEDAAWHRHAEQRIALLRDKYGQRAGKGGDRPWSALDAALLDRDLKLARRRARLARIDPRLVSARAIAVGRPEVALEEAELRLGADPEDSDARVALALAADLMGQSERSVEVLRARPDGAAPLGPVGRMLLAELLLRHAGLPALGEWTASDEQGSGPIERELLERLRARISRAKGEP
jgi:hypothetical protein